MGHPFFVVAKLCFLYESFMEMTPEHDIFEHNTSILVIANKTPTKAR